MARRGIMTTTGRTFPKGKEEKSEAKEEDKLPDPNDHLSHEFHWERARRNMGLSPDQ